MTPLDLANAEIERLRAQVESLKTDVRFYRREVQIEHADEMALTLSARLRIRPQLAWLLAALYTSGDKGLRRTFILMNMPMREAGEPTQRHHKIVEVGICGIRRRLGNDVVHSIWGKGYALSPKGVECVRRVLSGDLSDLPDARPTRSRFETRKLSETAVRVIRHAGPGWTTARALASAYNCSVGLVYGVRNGELYADVV